MYWKEVPHRVETRCKWCIGQVSFTEEMKPREHGRDYGSYKLKWDYHEGCWAEAIEVQI